MKAYEVIGEWKHKKTEKTYTLRYVVLTDDNQAPLDVINNVLHMEALEYVDGLIRELGVNTVIEVKRHAIKT